MSADERKPKKTGTFVFPLDENEAKDNAEDTGLETAIAALGTEGSGTTKKKTKLLFFVIPAIVLVVLLIVFLPKGNKTNTEPQPALPTAEPYTANGFAVSNTEIKLLDRQYINAFENKYSYYETVFNIEPENKDFDSMAVPVAADEIPQSAMKRSELVFAIHYHQNSLVETSIDGTVVLTLPSGESKREQVTYQGLLSNGIIYIGLDAVQAGSEQWTAGKYHLELLLNELLALETDFTLI